MAITVYTSSQISILLEDNPMASGGEGAVHRLMPNANYSNCCVKIYHPDKRNIFRKEKIEFMVQHKPTVLNGEKFIICWPIEMIWDRNRNFIGFIMPLAFTGSENLYEITTVQLATSLTSNWSKFNRTTKAGIEKRFKVCVNIAIAVHAIHQSQKYVIVDFKPQNILITNDGRISLTDIDSIQISDNSKVIFHSEVSTPEYSPPESIRITPQNSYVPEYWDRFSLAVTYYEILFGIHPYAATSGGQYGNVTTIGEKISKGLFVYGSKGTYLTIIPPIHKNFGNVPASIRTLFINAFEPKNSEPKARPSAEEWGFTIDNELKNNPNAINPNSVTIPVKHTPRKPVAPSTKVITSQNINAPQKKKSSYAWLWLLLIPFAIYTCNKIFSSNSTNVNPPFGNTGSGNTTTTSIPPPQNNSSNTSPASTNKVNPFGAGNGKLTIYRTCKYCSEIKVAVDGDTLGTLSKIFNESNPPSCGDYGTLSKILPSGYHTVGGKDGDNHTWNFRVYITEGECAEEKIFLENDVNPFPYGKGNGKITIYKTCNNCPDLEVSIDGDYIGTLSKTFDDLNPPSCDDPGTVSKIIPSGVRKLTGKDSYGTNWSSEVIITEGMCTTRGLTKNNDAKPNPYGTGNGQVTIYHTCSNCSNVQVSIDSYYSGTLTKYYSTSSPSCGVQIDGGTIVKNLSVGSHTITGKDDKGHTWTGYVYVTESSCAVHALQNFKEGNPYGQGNGEVSFWSKLNNSYYIYVDGIYKGSLTKYFPNGVPTCEHDGTLNITLPEGNHTFEAKDSRGGGWKGSFILPKNECIVVPVNK